MIYTASDPEDMYKALQEVDFDASQLIIDTDADAVFTSKREHLAWLIELEAICGCEHEFDDHVDLDDNGYRVCTQCGLNPLFMCVLDRGNYGVAAADYLKIREQPGPDAYRHTP